MKARYLSLRPYIHWRHSPRPLSWPVYFGRQAPLEVELGFGNGEFLVRQAKAQPQHNFVGIELEWASVQRALRKIAQTGTRNVRLLLADARVALERLFVPQSITRVYALFPCPWPKERHAKHRLFSHAFLLLLNSRVVNEGEVLIVTDHRPYAEWILAQVPGTGFEAQLTAISPRYSTKYERKWHAQGQEQFYELSLHKAIHNHVPLKEDITLQIHRVSHFDPERFHPTGSRGDITVAFKECLYDPKRQKAMLWVFVAEEGLTQDFWIEVSRGDTCWYIRPARGCGIVPTVGVQRALDLVRDAALRSAPALQTQHLDT